MQFLLNYVSNCVFVRLHSFILLLFPFFILSKWHMTFLYSLPSACWVSGECQTKDECAQREYYVIRWNRFSNPLSLFLLIQIYTLYNVQFKIILN